jgi:hypothetical protein
LIEGADAKDVAPTPVKKQPPRGRKRAFAEEKPKPKKRQKKEETLSEEEEPEEEPSELSEESPLSEFNDSDVSEAPKSKSKSRTQIKPQTKKKRAKVESDESEDEDTGELSSVKDEDSDVASTPPRKAAPKKVRREVSRGDNKRKSKKAVVVSDDESEDGKPTEEKSVSPEKTKSTSIPRWESPSAPKSDDEDNKPEAKAHDSDSSEMSIVLDEPPKAEKRGRKPNSDASSTSKTTKSKAAPKELSPTESQIKTLQSQLLKCGVRKIWAFELKQYGEDSQGKIRHLQGMLRAVGMTGRFSEQRAKEIKELRELQADLEAVREGDSKWGLEGGRRARSGQRKSLKEDSVDEDDDEGDEGTDTDGKKTKSHSMSEKPQSKAARAKQELAFLGDDDESDSD